MGGYLQGAGHNPLSGYYGMAADSVLAYQVVLSSGEFVTASATSNSDLFWALRGGGGGTYGIVTSAIVKAHPKIEVTHSTFVLGNSTDGTQIVSRENFWEGVKKFWESFPAYTDAGTYSFFFLFNTNGQLTLDMKSFFAPGHTKESYQKLTKPWFHAVKDLGIPFKTLQNTTYYPTYFEAYMDAWGKNSFPMGTATSLPVARFWDRTIPGSCLDAKQYVLSNVIITIITDVLVTLIPVWILHGLQIPLKNKITIICFLSLGLIVTAIASYRLAWFVKVFRLKDPLRQESPYNVRTPLSNIEANLAAIAACGATIKWILGRFIPFFDTARVNKGSRGYTANNSSHLNNERSKRNFRISKTDLDVDLTPVDSDEFRAQNESENDIVEMEDKRWKGARYRADTDAQSDEQRIVGGDAEGGIVKGSARIRCYLMQIFVQVFSLSTLSRRSMKIEERGITS